MLLEEGALTDPLAELLAVEPLREDALTDPDLTEPALEEVPPRTEDLRDEAGESLAENSMIWVFRTGDPVRLIFSSSSIDRIYK